MAYGTLPNIANAGHEPTPDERAEQVAHNLLKLPRSHFTVIDRIIPARSAWDRRFITAWARRCYGVRAWKFPSTGDIEDKAGFERYSQIVVIGYKRPQPLAEADERDLAAMLQWRYVRNADG